MTTVISLGSYWFWGCVLVVILFILWLFFGGNRDLEIVGLTPLMGPIGYSPSRLRPGTPPVSPPPAPPGGPPPPSPPLPSHSSPSYTLSDVSGPDTIIKGVVSSRNESSPRAVAENNGQSSANDEKVDMRRFKSIGEELTCKAFEEILGRPVQINARPNFLRNPETGRNLEYDCYDEVSKIAVEYSGRQHREYTPYFHKTEDAFHKQQHRDRLKLRLSIENGVTLIVIPDTVDVCDGNGCYNRRITKDERRQRIRTHLDASMQNVVASMQD